MNIRISNEALSAENSELLWTGALYGLKRLQQLALLENEQISSASKSESVDLQIIAEGTTLKAIDNEGNEIEKAEDWISLSNKICFPTRKASLQRDTAETEISIAINLDGTGESDISTGLGFFDHMLEQIAKHGLIDLNISCAGDLDVDEHHTIEDVAIILGQVIEQALAEKVGIQRYGFALPMDESLANIALDFSGRAYLVFDGEFNREKVGDFPTEMAEHFFYTLAMNLNATLHISVRGHNDHHKIEACFKGFARCLRGAVSRSERNANILPSTKDLL